MTTIHITSTKKSTNGITDLNVTKTGKTIIAGFNEAEYISGCFKNNKHPYDEMSSSLIYAISLIDEVFLYLIDSYLSKNEDSLSSELFIHLKEKIGYENLRTFISGYSETFNYKGQKETDQEILLKDLITLGTSYNNRAYTPFRDIFFSSEKRQNEVMFSVYNEIESFFSKAAGFGPDKINLIKFLRTPSEMAPESVMDQLKFIIEHWGHLIGGLRLKLLTGLDHLKEEKKERFSGSGHTLPYTFPSGSEDDSDNFSRDKDWMSSLVLIAKSTYVWLHQLSRTYKTEIYRLDQIPDEELDKIAAQGFSGLWLIGIWERSKASAEIKKISGNPEAMSSAYSIYDYTISHDLGGEKAFLLLRKKALKRGIRLAGDMVPNHMGIDSKWVCENPDWFISTEFPPFGSYTFNGPDLCNDERYSIHLEDHYYNKSDAAVVFEFAEHSTGSKRYIYHGNDGTSMPWNDTAQLNYLRSEVREYLINTIIQIAKKFKIIRFDAAMILTKKHFQRLWFPEPGGGGDIPSRAGRGLSKEDFSELFSKEFWKEVVERIASETPDTLLLAEAFWLMEPYFVRTLGMHRVYNSAFMNFLKNEENADFRTSIKNTIEFNPEILKRFANFMNNPDEETAISQFGSDDKYFGVCILLSTLPGLPMFGHGQIEGFREKYGMEYRKAYIDETPDRHLLKRHEKEIFPLLKQREIFSQSENFRLYDFINHSGEVNEDVIAYSNSFNGKHSLIVYNNKYSDCTGTIRISCPFVEFSYDGGKNIRTNEIIDALNIHPDHNKFLIFRDIINSLTYIRRTTEIAENGMYFELGAFKYHVFLDFNVIGDTESLKYKRLHEHLNGRGINDIEKLYEQEINNPVSKLIREMFQHFNNFMFKDPKKIDKQKLLHFCNKISYKISGIENFDKRAAECRSQLILKIDGLNNLKEDIQLLSQNIDLKNSFQDPDNHRYLLPVLLPSIVFRNTLKQLNTETEYNKIEHLSKYFIWDIVKDIHIQSGASEPQPSIIVKMIKVVLKFSKLFINISTKKTCKNHLDLFFMDEEIRSLTGVNTFKGKQWYHSHYFKQISLILFITSYIELYKSGLAEKDLNKKNFRILEQSFSTFINADKGSENLYEELRKEIYANIKKSSL